MVTDDCSPIFILGLRSHASEHSLQSREKLTPSHVDNLAGWHTLEHSPHETVPSGLSHMFIVSVWHDGTAGKSVRSVNLSARQFLSNQIVIEWLPQAPDRDFVKHHDTCIFGHRCPAESLVLTFTYSSPLQVAGSRYVKVHHGHIPSSLVVLTPNGNGGNSSQRVQWHALSHHVHQRLSENTTSHGVHDVTRCAQHFHSDDNQLNTISITINIIF